MCQRGEDRQTTSCQPGTVIDNSQAAQCLAEAKLLHGEVVEFVVTLGDLRNLRQSVRQDDPEMARELQGLIRQMQDLDPSRFPGNPALVERLTTQVLPNLEQIELRLRRQLEEDAGGQVHGGLTRPVPPGYADAVAEYFRKLSEGR